jgi:hypothetical protein
MCFIVRIDIYYYFGCFLWSWNFSWHKILFCTKEHLLAWRKWKHILLMYIWKTNTCSKPRLTSL